MNTPKIISTLAVAAALVSIALAGTGCRTAAEAATAARDPFAVGINGGEGIVVELKGNAHGHRAGGETRFELALRNDSGDVWQGRYCLVLVDRSRPVATFASEEFSLQPGGGEARPVDVRLPAGLAGGCYGLALVVPDRGATVTTITVGDGDGPCTGPWSAPECP